MIDAEHAAQQGGIYLSPSLLLCSKHRRRCCRNLRRRRRCQRALLCARELIVDAVAEQQHEMVGGPDLPSLILNGVDVDIAFAPARPHRCCRRRELVVSVADVSTLLRVLIACCSIIILSLRNTNYKACMHKCTCKHHAAHPEP